MHRGTVSAHSAEGVNTFAFSVAAARRETEPPAARANAGVPAEAAAYSSLVKGKSA